MPSEAQTCHAVPFLFIHQLLPLYDAFSSQLLLSVFIPLIHFCPSILHFFHFFLCDMHHSITSPVSEYAPLYTTPLFLIVVSSFSHPVPLSMSHYTHSKVLEVTGRDLLTDLI